MLQDFSAVFSLEGNAFEDLALNLFRYQAEYNPIYNTFLNYLGVNPSKIENIEAIPFLPIELFKSHKIVTGKSVSEKSEVEKNKIECVFSSSGTTGQTKSKHFVADLNLYEQSFFKGFELFYGAPEDYCFLALLPSYLERQGSSLVYMTEALIKRSKHPLSGFYLDDYDALIEQLTNLEQRGQKTILVGVTYALLDLVERGEMPLEHTIVMETGGMKGRRKEMIRSELYAILKKGFGVKSVHSEYGMTELLSQAYGIDGRFRTPNWMKILIRETNDPLNILPDGRTGAINVIDLANQYSCAFIATSDLGKMHVDGSFEVLGRMDHSDVRGCNLMVY